MATRATKKQAEVQAPQESEAQKTKAAAAVQMSEKASELLNATQLKAVESLNTVSAKIRYLDSEGFSRGQIAEMLNKKYQHVRNVLITPVQKVRDAATS